MNTQNPRAAAYSYHDRYLKSLTLFSKIWTTIILVINIWNLFSVSFWVSIRQKPENGFKSIALISEVLFAADCLLRLMLKYCKISTLKDLMAFHWDEQEHWAVLGLIIVGSMPQVAFWDIFNIDVSNTLIYLLAFKLCRIFEMYRARDFVDKYLLINQYESFVTANILQNLFYLIIFTHLVTCSWLWVNTEIGGLKF